MFTCQQDFVFDLKTWGGGGGGGGGGFVMLVCSSNCALLCLGFFMSARLY